MVDGIFSIWFGSGEVSRGPNACSVDHRDGLASLLLSWLDEDGDEKNCDHERRRMARYRTCH